MRAIGTIRITIKCCLTSGAVGLMDNYSIYLNNAANFCNVLLLNSKKSLQFNLWMLNNAKFIYYQHNALPKSTFALPVYCHSTTSSLRVVKSVCRIQLRN